MGKNIKTFGLVKNPSGSLAKPTKWWFIFLIVIAILLAFLAILGRLPKAFAECPAACRLSDNYRN